MTNLIKLFYQRYQDKIMLLDSESATEDVHYIGAYNSESAMNLEQ